MLVNVVAVVSKPASKKRTDYNMNYNIFKLSVNFHWVGYHKNSLLINNLVNNPEFPVILTNNASN
jgi:hypothetical protein